MSESVRTEAIVLRTMKYRETSVIVTLYTKEFGKVSGIVKGARQTKGKFGSAFQPMARLQTMMYRKEGRDLQTIGQVDVLDDFRHIHDALPKMAVGMKMIELVQMISHEEANVHLFDLLAAALGALDEARGDFALLFPWFVVSLCFLLGFEPTFHECIGCGRKKSPTGSPATRLRFHLERGGVLCDSCDSVTGATLTVRRSVIDLLDRIAQGSDPAPVMALVASREERAEMEMLLWAYLRHHVAGVRPLKSEKVFAKILPDS
jgi:DNA repair protein RecO (recombination protein O)